LSVSLAEIIQDVLFPVEKPMSVSVLDEATSQKLLKAGNEVELRSASGGLLAKYVRIDGPPTLPPGYYLDEEWPSREELQRRVREDRRYSAEEVKAMLKQLRSARDEG